MRVHKIGNITVFQYDENCDHYQEKVKFFDRPEYKDKALINFCVVCSPPVGSCSLSNERHSQMITILLRHELLTVEIIKYMEENGGYWEVAVECASPEEACTKMWAAVGDRSLDKFGSVVDIYVYYNGYTSVKYD